MSRRKSDQKRLPATRLLGSKLFGLPLPAIGERPVYLGARHDATHAALSPGMTSIEVASSARNPHIPGRPPQSDKAGASSLLGIGFGDASA